MSINYTIANYLAAGVPAAKLMVGIPLYGHTWFNPTLGSGSAWARFGSPAQVQGKCCGPFATTSGAAPGQGSSLCGTMMLSEIYAANASLSTLDAATASNIAYFASEGADGYTAAGTWVTYNDVDSMRAIVAYAKAHGLGGVFAFDSSMDTMDGSGAFTYTAMNAIADALGRDVPARR